jgi:hypothetical protein
MVILLKSDGCQSAVQEFVPDGLLLGIVSMSIPRGVDGDESCTSCQAARNVEVIVP